MVYLEPDQLRALRKRAREERVSVAELVRRAVQQSLEARPSVALPDAEAYERLIGLGSSGHADIGDKHDEYLAEALGREHLR